eukprot:549271-Pleurochrysis_carterae.AAC.1
MWLHKLAPFQARRRVVPPRFPACLLTSSLAPPPVAPALRDRTHSAPGDDGWGNGAVVPATGALVPVPEKDARPCGTW